MKNMLMIAASAAALLVPASAGAQAIPPGVIAVVDLNTVTATCNACKTALAALNSKKAGLDSRARALSTPLETEQKSIQAAVDALKGAEPDAALQARAKAWETKRQAAAQEMTRAQDQAQRDQAYIQKQIGDKLGPIYSQVMTKRGANVLMEVGSTLATSQSIDVTADVLAALNAALPTIVTTAPAAPAQQKPQGR